mgnify:CR=1 FL=1
MLKKVNNWDESMNSKSLLSTGEMKQKVDAEGNVTEVVNEEFDKMANETDLLNDDDLE